MRKESILERSREGIVPKYDIAKLNVALDRPLAVTENPRHHFYSKRITGTGFWEIAGLECQT
jgi:hypothetical protein